MSLDKLKADELRVLASEGFAVDVPENANKSQLVAALVENGVTWDAALQSPFLPERFKPVVEPEPVVEQPVVTTASLKAEPEVVAVVTEPEEPVRITPKISVPDKVLLKMDRENPRYDIRGYKFTAAHPFALVSEADAEYITENIEGFKYASPKEAREFYG